MVRTRLLLLRWRIELWSRIQFVSAKLPSSRRIRYAVAITVAAIICIAFSIWAFKHWEDPDREYKIYSFAVAWFPLAISVFVAFIPDLEKWGKKAMVAWRVAIVIAGLTWSWTLWHYQSLTLTSSRKDQEKLLAAAVTQSNKHADEQIAEVRKDVRGVRDDVQAVSKHSDEEIAGVSNNLKDSTDALSSALSRNAQEVSKNIDRVKPSAPKLAQLQFSFYVDNADLFPVSSKVLRQNEDKTWSFDVIFKNTSDVAAKDIDVWLEICDACTFVKEPSGYDKPNGSSELIRHKHVALLNPGVFFEKNTIDVSIKGTFTFAEMAFRYSCETCGKGMVERASAQKIRAVMEMR